MKIYYKVIAIIFLIIAFIYMIHLMKIEVPEFISIIIIILFLPIYILALIGMDFLLENSGKCGWGFCGISYAGYLILFVFYYLLGVGVTKLFKRIKK